MRCYGLITILINNLFPKSHSIVSLICKVSEKLPSRTEHNLKNSWRKKYLHDSLGCRLRYLNNKISKGYSNNCSSKKKNDINSTISISLKLLIWNFEHNLPQLITTGKSSTRFLIYYTQISIYVRFLCIQCGLCRCPLEQQRKRILNFARSLVM